MDANGGPKGEGQTLKQLRRTLELEGVDDDAGSDQIQTDFGQNPAVLRLQQMQADQEPAQDDTQKKLYDLFKQHQYHENVPPSTHRCEFNRTTPKEEKQPESLYSVKKLGLQ